MAWSAPTNDPSQKDKDPWTGEPKKPAGNDKGPPLLEDLFKNLFKKNSSGSSKPPSFYKDKLSANIITATVAGALVLLWAGTSVYKLGSNQEGLVFHLGIYQKNIGAGVHWLPFGIDRVLVYDREKAFENTVSTEALSADNNLVHLKMKFSYHVNDPKNYFTHAGNNSTIIDAVATSVLQQAAASNRLSALLADDNNSAFLTQLQQNLTKALDAAQLGVVINQVALTQISVPDALKDAFDKIDALFSEQALEKQKAADYEKQIIPPAEAKADQMIADAKAYAAQATFKAKTDVADFLAELPVYQKAPAFTRYQLYSQTMQGILSKVTKVVVDDKAHATVAIPSIPTNENMSPDNTTNTSNLAAATPSTTAEPTEDESTNQTSMSSSIYSDIKGGY
ncbi:MAG: hflK [Gammaproteobacteria bacterium]|jgi:membrane protease subunit HflK|nr:hflK [Gammaproteobacteria bacterium]